jgi:hypothetical protein
MEATMADPIKTPQTPTVTTPPAAPAVAPSTVPGNTHGKGNEPRKS